MPNWCSNQIKLGGPTEEIERIWNTLEDEKNDDGLLSAIAPLGGEWDYQDAISSWGIKHDHGLQFDKNEKYSEIHGQFESAWSPPCQAVDTWLSKNPECDAELLYCEFSNDFCGTLNAGDFTISECSISWFLGDETGIQLEEAFEILGMKEDLLEYEHEEALVEPITLLNPENEV